MDSSNEHARVIQASYNAVARAYADEIFDELKNKPFDRNQLDRFADRVRGRGLVCDLGCGPAQVARYLQERGVNAFGFDLSAAMLSEAQRLNPDLSFVLGCMFAMGLRSDSLAGIAPPAANRPMTSCSSRVSVIPCTRYSINASHTSGKSGATISRPIASE